MLKKLFCIRGHNLLLVGQRKDRHCSECNRENARNYASRHKEKMLQKNKQYYLANPEKIRENTLRRLYGLTLNQYKTILDSQNNSCAICGIHQRKLKKNLMVDHDHTSNRVRGLLCSKCNLLLGNAKDSLLILQNAIKYLTQQFVS